MSDRKLVDLIGQIAVKIIKEFHRKRFFFVYLFERFINIITLRLLYAILLRLKNTFNNEKWH